MMTVFFDEAGNTGHDLLNKSQTAYVLASTDIADGEAHELICEYFRSPETLHFKSKRRSRSGRGEILRFFREQAAGLNPRFKTMVIDKEYMAVCQMLNYLVEPQLYESGIDYFDRGMNIAHANMMYHAIPGFCGRDAAERSYRAFIAMFVSRTPESVRQFYASIDELERKCADAEFVPDIHVFANSFADIPSLLPQVDKYVLDPAMRALIDLSGHWNEIAEDGLGIVHDRSNSIRNQKSVLDFLVNLDMPPTRVGYGEFKQTFPLDIRDFVFRSSKDSPSLKLCDIVASALFILANRTKSDELANELRSSLSGWTLTNNITPSADVGPIDQRAKQPGDIESTDFLANYLVREQHDE